MNVPQQNKYECDMSLYSFGSVNTTRFNNDRDLLENKATKSPILTESIDKSKGLIYGQ